MAWNQAEGIITKSRPNPLDSQKQFTSDYLFTVKELNASELLNDCIHYSKKGRGVKAKHHSGKDEEQHDAVFTEHKESLPCDLMRSPTLPAFYHLHQG